MPGLVTYAALLRGVNLGARNRIAMGDLRALVRDLGGEEARTYVQSGNVVFGSADAPGELARAIEAGIHDRLGLDVTVLVRSAAQLAAIVAATPFPAATPDSTRHLVTFLASAPDPRSLSGLDASAFDPDEFRIVGEEIYLHCPGGYGRSKLSNAFFERRLDVAATTRNWRTVTALAELASPGYTATP